jgi:DNA-binding response OmpR family regulator
MLMKTILIADDEKSIREIIKTYLENSGYTVKSFENGDALLEYFQSHGGDLAILDIMMPGSDGYEICRKLRRDSDLPIIFVSAKDEEFDRILGLELGSDDYLSKPFSPRELVVRVKNLFRRIDQSSQSKPQALTLLNTIIYPEQRKVLSGDSEISFTKKEFDLFLYMCSHKNRAFSRNQLIEEVWGFEYIGETRIIDDVIKRIRKKLTASLSTVVITTVWGYGYKIEGE